MAMGATQMRATKMRATLKGLASERAQIGQARACPYDADHSFAVRFFGRTRALSGGQMSLADCFPPEHKKKGVIISFAVIIVIAGAIIVMNRLGG